MITSVGGIISAEVPRPSVDDDGDDDDDDEAEEEEEEEEEEARRTRSEASLRPRSPVSRKVAASGATDDRSTYRRMPSLPSPGSGRSSAARTTRRSGRRRREVRRTIESYEALQHNF